MKIFSSAIIILMLSIGLTMGLNINKIQIKHSDEMVYDGKTHTLEYTGSVHIVSENMELKAERVVLYFNEKENEVIKADAFGNVYMKKDEFNAEAGKAVYDIKKGIINLSIDPVVYKVDQRIKADNIIYWVNERRLQAKGNVSGFFIPEKKKKQDNGDSKKIGDRSRK